MSTTVSSWSCPQCGRRVPARAPLCHCGVARAEAGGPASAAGLGSEVAPPWAAAPAPPRHRSLLLAALAASVVGAIVYVAATDPGAVVGAGGPAASAPYRGPAGYPPLPPAATLRLRHARRGGLVGSAPAGSDATHPATAAAASPPRPMTSAEQEWARAMALLDLPLRKIAADTSVLELSQGPFAEACVEAAGDSAGRTRPAGGAWLASLKTSRLRAGVTLRQKGATVDCETARRSLIARADTLKADLDAASRLARANGVSPTVWRALLATHDLEVWDGY